MKINTFILLTLFVLFNLFWSSSFFGKEYNITGNWKSSHGKLIRVATFPKADFIIMISAQDNVNVGEAHEGKWVNKGKTFYFFHKKEQQKYFGQFLTQNKIIIKNEQGKVIDNWIRTKN